MEAPGFHHLSVLLEECIDALAIREDGFYIDVTAGGAGHSAAILERLGPGGRLLAMDRDLEAVAAAGARLKMVHGDRVDAPDFEVVHAPMSTLASVVQEREGRTGCVDGILADLGVSSHQLSTAERGFSFSHDGPLDMRMDRSCGVSAAELVNDTPEVELANLIYRFGDEPKSRRIARSLVQRRVTQSFTRTADLAEAISRACGGRRGAKTHPATRTFQALRMVVNDEAGELAVLLDCAVGLLRPGGRLAVISFHSGEDRVVKQHFARLATVCTCPPSVPVCVCAGRASVRLPVRRGITPSATELSINPRSRSARLRIAETLSALEEPAGER
jgi:16S rRNA (cytosine1402-N4)-methyltransferase